MPETQNRNYLFANMSAKGKQLDMGDYVLDPIDLEYSSYSPAYQKGLRLNFDETGKPYKLEGSTTDGVSYYEAFNQPSIDAAINRYKTSSLPQHQYFITNNQAYKIHKKQPLEMMYVNLPDINITAKSTNAKSSKPQFSQQGSKLNYLNYFV